MENRNLEKNMLEGIKRSGGVFCQYRPCRRDVSTIYDIENIKNGVVYAQTPLNMNDPFDSFIGYSSQNIYNEIINMMVDGMGFDDNTKLVIFNILKYKCLDKFADLLSDLKSIKKYYLEMRNKTNYVDDILYVKRNLNKLYSGRPQNLKIKFSKNEFAVLLYSVIQIDDINLSENGILEFYKLDSILDQLLELVENTKSIFIDKMKEFLSKITISCFTNSGWNNQLMWSHYANSYSGICIEYDLNMLKTFQGFVYPVKYDENRPLLSIKDIGIDGFDFENKTIKHNPDIDIETIISKLLYKNVCWNYEKEWRIINIGDAYEPKFLDIPFIKSITFGLKMDPVCKQYLYEVCREKSIPCYQITVANDCYALNRVLTKDSDMIYDSDNELRYIKVLKEQLEKTAIRTSALSETVNEEIKNMDYSNVCNLIDVYLDLMLDAYFIKISMNRIIKNEADDEYALIPDEIVETSKSLDGLIPAADSILQLENNYNLLLVKDGYTILKKIKDVKEMKERYNSIKWHENIRSRIDK